MNQNEKLESIVFQENGSIYVIYKIQVQRGIKGKTKSKADEVLIVGVPKSGSERWLKANGLLHLTQFIGTKTVVKAANN